MTNIHMEISPTFLEIKITIKNDIFFCCLKDWQRLKRSTILSIGRVNTLINSVNWYDLSGGKFGTVYQYSIWASPFTH